MAGISRAQQTRAATARPMIAPNQKGKLDIDVSSLPPDLEATWIRESTLGEYDDNNVQDAMERGYRPVEAKDLPGYQTFKLPGARGSTMPDDTLVRKGGVVLMARDRRLAEAERAAYADETAENLRSVALEPSAPKDGRNFQDTPAEFSVQTERRGRFSE
jgi:hypothetical protein